MCYFKLQQEAGMLRIKAETKAAQRSWRPVLPFLPSRGYGLCMTSLPPPAATSPH